MRTSFDDKIEHTLVYGILGALSYRALRRASEWPGGRAIAASGLIALGYGLSDEIHQLFVPLRSFEWLDVAADISGGTLGALGGYLGEWLRARRGF
jgi:VanZ family protein